MLESIRDGLMRELQVLEKSITQESVRLDSVEASVVPLAPLESLLAPLQDAMKIQEETIQEENTMQIQDDEI